VNIRGGLLGNGVDGQWGVRGEEVAAVKNEGEGMSDGVGVAVAEDTERLCLLWAVPSVVSSSR
jgi:hypothetical protein